MSWIKFLLVLIVVLYLLVGLFLFLFHERMIFRPEVLPADYQFRFNADYDELNLEMEDGAILNTLHFKTEKPKGIIVYFHGNAGDLSKWGDVVIPLQKFGYEVLIPDYRGYGKSTGKRTKKAMLDDAEAIYAHASGIWEQDQIVVYGRSLGGAFATHVSSEFSPKTLILESPFYSVADVARSFAWMYPVGPMMQFNFKNQIPIKKVECSIHIIHGTEDMIVPIKSGKKLSEASEQANLYEIPKAGHNNLSGFMAYWEVIEKALK